MKKKYIIIVGLVFLAVMGFLYLFRNLSFTKYNVNPARMCKAFLERTYGENFEIISTSYFEYRVDRVWKIKFENEDGLEFYEYYLHPRESGEGFFYPCFDKDYGEYGIRDYYWQAVLQSAYPDLELESFQAEFSSSTPRYCFEISSEQDIEEVTDIISVTLCHILKQIKEFPNERTLGIYDIKYCGEFICQINIDKEIEKLSYWDVDTLGNYVYEQIQSGYMKEQ